MSLMMGLSLMSLMMGLSLMSLMKIVPHETQCRTCQQACRASMWPLKVPTSPFKLVMDCALVCVNKEACLSDLRSLVHIQQTCLCLAVGNKHTSEFRRYTKQ